MIRKLVDEYIDNLDEVFAIISQCENNDLDIDQLLDGDVCHSEFTRLN
jgi:hypothetical protein